ncbi:MAG TPA: hypothetical protein VMU34_15640 [Mycobacterium sp.]|nr:hypothetical protein [Mycobacterium sp.]
MRTIRRCVTGGLATVAAAAIGIGAAPSAAADCQGSGAATVCAQGTVTAADPTSPTSGPYYPYDCQDDYLCYNGPNSMLYGGYPGGCVNAYGTYQNCAIRR